MKKRFSYPLPDELYVDSFDLGKEFSAEYDGPEKLQILVNKMTREISGVNPDAYDSDNYDLIEIDCEQFPEAAYYILNSAFEYSYEYEEEIMPNGDIYQNPVNFTIWDAYNLYYDLDESEFIFELIIKTNPGNYLIRALSTVKNKLNYVINHEEGKVQKSEPPGVSKEILKSVSDFILIIDTCMDQNIMFAEWKYSNFDTILESFLTIPEELKDLLNTYQ